MDANLPQWFQLFMGVAEVAAAIGLILPGLTRVMPFLVTWAAVGIGIIMVSATGYRPNSQQVQLHGDHLHPAPDGDVPRLRAAAPAADRGLDPQVRPLAEPFLGYPTPSAWEGEGRRVCGSRRVAEPRRRVPLQAQSRVYGDKVVAIDSGSRGAFDALATSFPAAQAGSSAFGPVLKVVMEVHANRAFAESAEQEVVVCPRSQAVRRAGPRQPPRLGGPSRVEDASPEPGRCGGDHGHRDAGISHGEGVRPANWDPAGGYPVDAGAGLAGGVLVPIVLGRGLVARPGSPSQPRPDR